MKQITIYVRDSDSPYIFDIALRKAIEDSLDKRLDIKVIDPGSSDSVFIPFHAITSVEVGDAEP